MDKFRFYKQAYGWSVYVRRGDVYVFFGDFSTQRRAREAYAIAMQERFQ